MEIMLGKNAVAVLGVTAAVLGGMYWKLGTINVPAYEADRVIDGDTFETTEKQLIRLADINAPEIQYCGGMEAKANLEKLLTDKKIYLKVIYRDPYMRLISLVYTEDGFVNAKMLSLGSATYKLTGDQNQETEILKQAAQEAKDKKVGIYSSKCTQLINPQKPWCFIKGNVKDDHKTKLYSTIGCESYASTLVQLYLGDEWFCTEAEAKKAGFTKAGGCGENLLF